MSSATTKDEEDDPWIAPDKLQHVAFCFSLACAGFALAASSMKKNSTPTTPTSAQQRLLAGALLALFGGSLKELGDFCGWWPGRASARDAAADAVGAALGLAACALFVAFDCRERVERELRKRKGLNNDASAARSRGEYRNLELSSSSAAEGKA